MFTVTIGGKAGDGVKAAGRLIAEIVSKIGYNSFVLNNYQSLITGGHNFSKITFSKEKIYNHYKETDILIALNKETFEIHKDELKKDGILIFDAPLNLDGYGIPASKFVGTVGGAKVMKNVALIGAFSFLLGIDFNVLRDVLREKFRHFEKNEKIAKLGYEFAKNNFKVFKKIKKVGKPKKLMSGNEAIANGAVNCGLNIYIAYPMTPSTPILHYLAKNSKKFNIKVIQAENEISVINMALGSSYAGAKTMIGTSGGGFSLMNEALSLSGMAEIPLVIVEAQRAGPSTGVPTFTSQSDLNFVINAGHGEFPKIVIAPGTNEDAYFKSAEALYLAWKYQIPVIILVDKHLCESIKTIEIGKVKKVKPIIWKGKNYKRYLIRRDGISPLSFPGKKDIVVKAASYEHDEFGITTEDPYMIKKMQDKRIRKMREIEKEIKKLETIKIYGNGKNLVVTWGSSVGSVIEASKKLKIKILQIIYMHPFPKKEVLKHLKKAKKIVCVEANATGQLSSLIKLHTGFEIRDKILKYDSRAFDSTELFKKLEGWIHES